MRDDSFRSLFPRKWQPNIQFKGVFSQPGPCIWSRNPYGKIKVKYMEEEEEEEDKKREREYFCRRDFLTQYKAPVA